MTDKLDLTSLDIVNENVKKIAELFPNCVTETANGKAIDFDLLKQELNHEIIEGNKERYRLEWPGKREAIVTANLPTTKTLRPVREDSVDFDNTQNIYIEGDNLEVLKLLQESYLGKIKVMCIDPPYNTGKDFVYKDNFTQDNAEHKEESGFVDELNRRLVVNPDSSGRYHSDWLTMMYPRLKLARNLLTEDGVIFISIDDNEVHNLRKICDEIFGENNFIDIFCWSKTETPANLSKKSKKIIEYILCYQKIKNDNKFTGIKKESQSSNGLLNQSNSLGKLVFPANTVKTNIPDGVIPKGKYGTDNYDVELLEDTEVKNKLFVSEVILKAKFKWSQDYLNNEIKNGTIINIPTIRFSPSYEKLEYDAEVPPNLINSKVNVGTNENAGTDLVALMGNKVFDFPKPVSLLKYLIKFNDDKDGIFLDFFSGSATLSEAIYELNFEGDEIGHRKYICVQLPEKIEIVSGDNEEQKKVKQNAIDLLNNNNKPNLITEIGKERIRRSIKRIKNKILSEQEKNEGKIDFQEKNTGYKNLDLGFRVYRLDDSNMKDIYYRPQDFKQEQLDVFADNIKPDRTSDDLLAQIMLDWGLPLSLKIELLTLDKKQVFKVAENSLMACFDLGLNEAFAKEIAKLKPLRVVFKDSSFEDNSAKENVKQLLKQLSPETEMKVI
jgi:adenine-specific DNA-methyltransferase